MAILTVNPTSYSVTDKNQNIISVNFTCDKTLADVKLSMDNGSTYKNKNSMTQTSAIFDITGMSNNNYSCKLKGIYEETGSPNIPVVGISLNKNSHTFTDFTTLQLTHTITPTDATDKTVTWSSNRPGVASVSNGLVTAKSNGNCIITVSTVDGNKTATCNITVNKEEIQNYEFDIVSKTYTSIRNGTVDIEGVCTYSNIDYWEVTSPDGWIGIANTFVDGKFKLSLSPYLGVGTYINCYMEAKRNAIAPETADKVIATSKSKFTLVVEETSSNVPVASVSLNKATHTFTQANETLQLTHTVVPSNATNKSVTWNSSNSNIATVSSSGLVTSKVNGTTIITVATVDGNKTATCNIAVNIQQGDVSVTGISLDQKTMTISNGQTKNLVATVTPSNATNKKVTWTSDNRSIIDVGYFGEVMCFGQGGATITATTQDGGFIDKCIVNEGIDGGGTEPPPPIPQPTKKMYHSIAYSLKPWENSFTLLQGLDMFKDYEYGSALICLPVDCSFPDNNPFCDVTETMINTVCDKVESLGLTPILKMHTVSLVEDGQGNQDTPQNATTWFSNYRTLVNKYADIVVKRGYKEFIVSNEMHNVMNKANWKSLFTPTISDVKAKGLKVSMSMNTPEVQGNDGFQFFDELDFYCMNTYPQLTKNGVSWARDNFEQLREGFYTPLSNMDIDYGALFKTMGGSGNLHKEIWLTEVGCINRERGLEYPAFWGGSDARNDEVQELWLKAVFDVLEKDKTNGKLTDRVTRYMLWDGNSDSDFNPVNKRGKSVLDTYWKDETPPEDIKVTGVSLDITSKVMKVDDRLELKHTINPSNATNKSVDWTTSNSEVATCIKGYVIARAKGTCTITVITQDGNKTATCNITVEENVAPPIEEVNHFDINNTNIALNGCTCDIDKANKNVTISSDYSSDFYGYVRWGISTLKEGRTYRLTAKSSDTKTFIRYVVDGNRLISQDFRNDYSFEFAGSNSSEKITNLEFGLRQIENIGTIESIFSDIKIIDVNGEPDTENDGVTYDIVDYKIIVSDGVNTESYHSCDDIPRNLNGLGGVDGYKAIVKDGIKHYLSLTNGDSPSKITINGMKPFNYSLIDQAFKDTWSNRGYAVANNTLKYTIANRINQTNNIVSGDKTISQKSLDRALSIYNCAIPDYMQITQDQNSVNSVSEAPFNDSFMGICRLHNGEKFHIHQNTRLLGGYGNGSRLYIGVLVHELGHTTGIWDHSPHYPTTYTYLKDQQNEWLQPSDIAHIKDKFPHLTGAARAFNEVEKTDNNCDVVFNFYHYKNEEEMEVKADKVLIGEFIELDSKHEKYELIYNVYSFKVCDEITKINVHESFDLKLIKGKTYKMYLNEFNYLLNPNETILEII